MSWRLAIHLKGAFVNVQIKTESLFLNVSQVAARYNVSTRHIPQEGMAVF